MYEWSLNEPDFVLINNLGFAFLRRMAIDQSVFSTANRADAQRELDGICSVWSLFCECLLEPLSCW